ncbi:MAG: hypothetical protein ACXWTU_05955, partial [Methylotenera sp.]
MTAFANNSLRLKSGFQYSILFSFLHALIRKTFVVWLLIINLFAAINTCAATEATTALTTAAVGCLNTISITRNEFLVQGWVAATNPNQKIIALV